MKVRITSIPPSRGIALFEWVLSHPNYCTLREEACRLLREDAEGLMKVFNHDGIRVHEDDLIRVMESMKNRVLPKGWEIPLDFIIQGNEEDIIYIRMKFL